MRRGFTLVELLLAISVPCFIARVLLAVFAGDIQNDRAADAVRRANIEQVVDGLETHFAVEGSYPDAPGDASLEIYITAWPDDQPEGAVYSYAVESNNMNFGVVVITSQDDLAYKYRSEWGEIRECADLDPDNTDCNP
jgi:type II secretory pathway pseudopilin PulG